MANLLPIDELNNLRSNLEEKFLNGGLDREECVDIVLDLLIASYVFGTKTACNDLGVDFIADTSEMRKSVFKTIDGQTFEDRVQKYADEQSVEKIMRVADTEMVRAYNEGIIDIGVRSGVPCKKVWNTELDDKVRETHSYLEGMECDLNEYFFTYDGDSALAPGGFTNAENNVNCRCTLNLIPK